MGLDIYFYRVKNTQGKNLTFKELYDLQEKRFHKRVERFAKRSLKALKEVDGNAEEYKKVYCSIFPNKIKRYTKLDFQYAPMMKGIKNFEYTKSWFNDFERKVFMPEDAYFRKVNFLYRFFEDRLDEECSFVTYDDLEEIISRCKKVLKNHSLAEELLPSRDGFFFGSTEYDNYYFDDVKYVLRQMKKLLKRYNVEKDTIFVYFSW